MAGRRRVSSFNPLSDNLQSETNDQWICVAYSVVNYYAKPVADAQLQITCEPNAKVRATKEGNWLVLLDDKGHHLEPGRYLPVKHPVSGERLFKNERVMLWENGRQRTGSAGSDEVSRYDSNESFGRQQSFNWVDSEGLSHRLSRTASEDPEECKKSEVWVCFAQSDVPYYTSPECHQSSGKFCKRGEKVNGVKEGNVLRVMEVSNSTSMTEMLGRRSLKASTQFNIKETGLYLPFTDTAGERLFKNEKLALWEQAQTATVSPDDLSFRWVDSQGLSHRLSRTASEDPEECKKSEVWVCAAERAVPYHMNPECNQPSGKFCKVGEKVNGVKEGNVLRVMVVSESTDMTEMIGRRSLKASTQFNIKETGLYIPFTDTAGERLFKNEKLALWEQAQRTTSTDNKDDQSQGGCSVM